MVWAVAICVFAVLIWALVEGAAVLGFMGVLMGERIERCGRCGRVGLTSHHEMHPKGCPQHLRGSFSTLGRRSRVTSITRISRTEHDRPGR